MNLSYSTKESGSLRTEIRSRAVSFPLACCAAMRFSPPPNLARSEVSSIYDQ